MGERAHHLLVSQMYALDAACVVLQRAFGNLYLVGSVLQRPDFRDVDVRCLLTDAEFAVLGGDKRLYLLNAAVSEWLRARTGLPIDFQFQAITAANEEFNGQRSALGIGL